MCKLDKKTNPFLEFIDLINQDEGEILGWMPCGKHPNYDDGVNRNHHRPESSQNTISRIDEYEH